MAHLQPEGEPTQTRALTTLGGRHKTGGIVGGYVPLLTVKVAVTVSVLVSVKVTNAVTV